MSGYDLQIAPDGVHLRTKSRHVLTSLTLDITGNVSGTAGSINDLAIQGNTTATAVATGTLSIALGRNSAAITEQGGIAIGSSSASNKGARATGICAVAIGSAKGSTALGAKATGSSSIAIGGGDDFDGSGPLASGDLSTAFGVYSVASGTYSVAFTGGTASGLGSFAYMGTASGANSIALRGNATASGAICIGLGTASATNAVSIANSTTNSTANTIVIGTTNTHTRLTTMGDHYPEADNTKDLGAVATRWRAGYIATVTGNLTGNVTGNLTGNVTGNVTGNLAGIADSANALRSASTTVNVSVALAPSAGQVLTATADNAATWQTPARYYASLYAHASSNSMTLTNDDQFYLLTPTAWANAVTASGMSTDTSTSEGRITVTNSGVYQISAYVSFTTSTSAQCFEMAVYKNGSVLADVPYGDIYVAAEAAAATEHTNMSVSYMVSLTAADYLQLFVRCTSGAGANFVPVEVSFLVRN